MKVNAWQHVSTQAGMRWQAWWQARTPPADQITLTQRRLYILPTKAGWSLGVVLLVLLLASINEQINLGYALSFLLAGVGLATMHRTHANAQGLRCQLTGAHSVHAGDVVRLGVTVSQADARKGRWGLRLDTLPLDLPPGGEQALLIDVPALQRGWQTLPRLTLQTRYPLGLFRVWAYWRPASRVLIWPALDAHAPALPTQDPARPHPTGRPPSARKGEAADGLRDYRRGDPMRLIAWKKSGRTLASGSGLVSREPPPQQGQDTWLDFDQSPGLMHLDAEARLRRLATWVLQAQAQGLRHGLRLPGCSLACDTGLTHARQCLDALAQWESPT